MFVESLTNEPLKNLLFKREDNDDIDIGMDDDENNGDLNESD